jgi:hypothetical protein
MTNPAGTRFAQQVVDYLTTHGFPHAERRAQHGRHDRGDIAGVIGWLFEIKALKQLDVAGAVDEAAKEAENAGSPWYAAIIKRRRKSVGDAYVVMPLSLFAELLREN